GRLTGPDGQPLSGLGVRAFDKGLPSLGAGSEQRLGGNKDAITDAEGSYRIPYTQDDFTVGEAGNQIKARPDVFIRVYDGDTPLGESVVHFNAPPYAHIDLTVEIPERSEYETIVHRLSPVLHGVSPANMTDEDIGLIEGERGVGESWLRHQKASREGSAFEKGRLNLLRHATQYAQKIGIPAEAFYGWARILDPNLTPDDLTRRPESELRQALVDAATKKIVPAALY